MLQPGPRQSAVILLIFPWKNVWSTLFIVRPEYDGVHSAQLGFPGGKKEEGDDDLQTTALRETNEEVGIRPDQIEVIGTLSEIFIPPSNFIVHPFVGLIRSEPEFIPDKREVAELLIEPLDHFFREPAVLMKKIYLKNFQVEIDAPCFDVQGRILWGATAMILQEFRHLAGFIK